MLRYRLRLFYVGVCCVAMVFGYLLWQAKSAINYDRPNYQLIDVDSFHIADIDGKVIYLDFWASWCIPCRDSFPWMNHMVDTYHQHGLRVVTINFDQQVDQMYTFLDAYPANFPVVFNPSFSLFREYKIRGLPTSVVFDSSGNTLATYTGFTPEKAKKHEQQIAQWLGLPNKKEQ